MEGSLSVTLTDDYHFELREIIYYYTGMNFAGRFGELGDSEHMARVGEHARMHAHVCSRLHISGNRSPCAYPGALIEHFIHTSG